jgi:hypothetical protein
MLQLFSRRSVAQSPPDELKPGDRYCRTLGHHFLETATILDLKNVVGIPHVCYRVVFEHPDAGPVDEGSRMLALSRFVDEYERQAS